MKSSGKKIITCILAAVCLFLLAFVGFYLYEMKKELDIQREEQAKIMAVEVNNPDMPEEYRELKANNPDVYGWLTIDGTEISVPVVQKAGDNSFYLSHDVFQEESDNGAVYSEDYNAKDFSDFLTVLYGNRSDEGAMFAGLLDYEDPVFFEEHRTIHIYLPDKTLEYRIFAAYTGDNSHLLLSRDLSKTENRERYIKEIYQWRGMKNNFDKTIPVTADSHILALSTGHPSGAESRFIVQAVQTE